MADAEDHDDHTFEGSTSGASESFPQQCSALRKGGYVLLKGKACKIVEMTTSKTGKHGHAKVYIYIYLKLGRGSSSEGQTNDRVPGYLKTNNK